MATSPTNPRKSLDNGVSFYQPAKTNIIHVYFFAWSQRQVQRLWCRLSNVTGLSQFANQHLTVVAPVVCSCMSSSISDAPLVLPSTRSCLAVNKFPLLNKSYATVIAVTNGIHSPFDSVQPKPSLISACISFYLSRHASFCVSRLLATVL